MLCCMWMCLECLEFIELQSFQILSTENGLFPFSLLPDGPSEDAKDPCSQISEIPKSKVTCWGWGHLPRCGAAMPWLSTACGVWSSGRSHPGDTAAVGTPEQSHTQVASELSSFFHPLLLPHAENFVPAPPWRFQGCSVLHPQGLSSPCRCFLGLQRGSCSGDDPPPFSPQWLGWLWLSSFGI